MYLFTSALHVSGFHLAHLQRQAYNFGSGSSLLLMVTCTPASEDGIKESPKHVRQK
jgi:hypothetical protein